MPLLRPVDYGIPQVPLVPLPPSTPPVSTHVTWTPAGGPTLELSKTTRSGIMLGGEGEPGKIIGLDMPPLAETEVELPPGGGLLTHQRWGVRSVALPVVIHADTLADLERHRRELVAALNPGRGEGVLTLAYPDGERRHLSAMYSSGMEDPGTGRQGGGAYYDTYTITLKARDPHPYGDTKRVVFKFLEGDDFYPVPYSLSKSSARGGVEIGGQVNVWPRWVLRGPIGEASLRHEGTGLALRVTPGLAAGQTMTIRTDPRTPPMEKFLTGMGVSAWKDAAGDFPVMWPLLPGSNTVSVSAVGSDETTSIELEYEPRYLTA